MKKGKKALAVVEVKPVVTFDLSERLDEIDRAVYGDVFEGFYNSRLRLLIGMWEKGEAIGEYTGVNSPVSYYQLEKETGRDHHSLKRWHEIYKKHPDKDKYIEIAEAKAMQWTKRALKDKNSKPELPEKTSDFIQPILYQKDCFSHDPGQVDLLLTDPPYSTDVEDIFTFAPRVIDLLKYVKPTGRAYICIGAYPNELAAYLGAPIPKHISLKQILVWTYRNTLGPAPKDLYKTNWQAILYFVGNEAGELDCPILNELFSVQDINAPDGRLGNRFHQWQKPIELSDRFVRHATKPNDTVYDPFCCTGTFLLSAAYLGRVAIGCEINQEAIDIAIDRGCALV